MTGPMIDKNPHNLVLAGHYRHARNQGIYVITGFPLVYVASKQWEAGVAYSNHTGDYVRTANNFIPDFTLVE